MPQAKTLVTGATGFLGSHLIRGLVEANGGSGKGLRVLTQASSAPSWLTDLGVEAVAGSIVDSGAVERALMGVDRIYHLAGLVSHKPADAHRMHQVHVQGTRVLCEAAARAKVARIVMASTSGTVAVSRRADEMPDESSPAPMDIIARWPYYASKVYQEETARRACGERVELVMVNPSLLLGPGDDRLSSTRPVLQFLARDIAMVPPGGFNFVDARDVAALLPAAMARGAPGQRYLVGGYNWTFAEFFGRLERLTKVAGPLLKSRGKLPLLATRAQAALWRHWGRTPPIEPQSVEMAEYFWYFDSGKAARELGFIPREATETLFDTVTYVRANFLGNGALRLSKKAG
ncbi:MAG TPA: NAD-dependent epimerase/dehydratase family protein [Polyangia bacterium]|jgi:dihydroflavonol-4-reductase|nr:NAD-dependent epimerase/dehydratase family protein [Polyangia bacterium]